MEWLLIPAVLVVLVVLSLVRTGVRAGPREVSEERLAGARTLLRLTAEDPGEGWTDTGCATRTRGLDVRFDADDDPEAEATLRLPDAPETARSTYANVRTVRLTDSFVTHHAHTAGHVFRIRLAGRDAVVGKEVRLQMVMAGKRPHGGRLENDDDDDAAVGDWIAVEWAEILELTE